MGRLLIARSDPAFILVSGRCSIAVFDGQPREQERIGIDDVGTHDPAIADIDMAGDFPALDAFRTDQFHI